LDNANLTRFMRALGVDSFDALNARASADPPWFHDELIRILDYRFERPYDQALDLSEGLPFAHWCVGGTTNVVLNCIDRQRGTARYTQAALVWEGEDGTVTTWTFADLDRETCRLAWGLRRLGPRRRGGHVSAQPAAGRCRHAGRGQDRRHCAADVFGFRCRRRCAAPERWPSQGADHGRWLPAPRQGVGAKVVVDEALQHCSGVQHVVVLRHLATAGLDVLPHNGAVIIALAVVGLTHKEAYKPIFMLVVLTPLFTNAMALVVAMVLY
jgi:acetyl-CoA synthetase